MTEKTEKEKKRFCWESSSSFSEFLIRLFDDTYTYESIDLRSIGMRKKKNVLRVTYNAVNVHSTLMRSVLSNLNKSKREI